MLELELEDADEVEVAFEVEVGSLSTKTRAVSAVVPRRNGIN